MWKGQVGRVLFLVGGFRRSRFAAQLQQLLLLDPLLQPDRPDAVGGVHPEQAVVEHRLQRLSPGVQQLQLQRGSAFAALPPEPHGIQVIGQEAVSIKGDPDSPACIALLEILQRCIPEQPIQKQWLLIRTLCHGNRDQPWFVAPWLGSFQALPLMQLPMQRGSGALHRFAPWISRPGSKPVASWSEVIELDASHAIGQLIDADQWPVIHLQGDVGTNAKDRVPADRPVLNAQHQLQGTGVIDTAGLRADQGQLWSSVAQLPLDFLTRSWWRHLLQNTCPALADCCLGVCCVPLHPSGKRYRGVDRPKQQQA